MDNSWHHHEHDLVFPDDVFAVDLGHSADTDCGLLSWNPGGPLISADPFFAAQGGHLAGVSAEGSSRGGLDSALSALVPSGGNCGPSAFIDQGPIGGSGRHAPRIPDVIPPQAAASAPSSLGSRSLACASTASTPTSSATSIPLNKDCSAESNREAKRSRNSSNPVSISTASTASHVAAKFSSVSLQQAAVVVSLQDFVWINEDHFVRVLVPLAGVEKLQLDRIQSSYTNNSFELEVSGLTRGVLYRLAIDSLYGDVQPQQCWHEVLPNKIIIHLMKIAGGPSDGPDTNIFTWFSLRL